MWSFNLLLVLVGVGLGVFGSRYFERFHIGRRRTMLVVWDGSIWHVEPATRKDTEIIGAKIRVPMGTPSMHITDLFGMQICVAALEKVALDEHVSVMRASKSVVMKSLFESGGNWVQYLQYGAIGLALMLVFISYTRVGDVARAQEQVIQQVGQIQGIVSEPLECKAVQ